MADSLEIPVAPVTVSETDVSLADPGGSCWVSNGTICVYVRFNGSEVEVSAHPDQQEATGLPMQSLPDGVAAWEMPSAR